MKAGAAPVYVGILNFTKPISPNAKAKAIPNPLAPLPIERGTITNAKGRVQGRTIIESPAAKLKRYQPNPTGVSGPKKKNQERPKTTIVSINTVVEIKIVLKFIVY